MHWYSVYDKLPPEGTVVMTKIDDGICKRNETLLYRKGNVWWLPGGDMYVYYTPTHWRYNY